MAVASARKALAGGFGGSGGSDEPPKSRLDLLIEAMIAKGRSFKIHPIATLYQHELYINTVCSNPSDDMKVEACRVILSRTEPDSILPKSAASLLIVLDDNPDGYLAKAIEKLGIEDFGAWLENKTIKPNVVAPKFGGCEPA